MISHQGFQRRSVILMLLLTVVTLGIYPLIWLYQTKKQLDRLDTQEWGQVLLLDFSPCR